MKNTVTVRGEIEFLVTNDTTGPATEPATDALEAMLGPRWREAVKDGTSVHLTDDRGADRLFVVRRGCLYPASSRTIPPSTGDEGHLACPNCGEDLKAELRIRATLVFADEEL